MKKIFACAFLFGICSFSVLADAAFYQMDSWEVEGNECKRQIRSKKIVEGCKNADGSFRSGPCSTEDLAKHQGHALAGECIQVRRTANGTLEPTCAATKCTNGYYLWLGFDTQAREWASMGVCHGPDYCKCGNCGEGGRCVRSIDFWTDGYGAKIANNVEQPYYNKCLCEYSDMDEIIIPTIPGTNPGPCDQYDTGTYERICCDKHGGSGTAGFNCCLAEKHGQNVSWNDELQRCECEITMNSDLKYFCPNSNKVVHLYNNGKKKIPFQASEDETCTAIQSAVSNYVDGVIEDIKALNNICNNAGAGNSVSYTSGVGISELDKWIKSLKRDKWKDASGNFNTARLASDLTAGVVLGTVGGVVSGVVIKKKQVEKGFEALNCYVGGQQMANWGDEFKVEFRRY